MKKVIWYLLKGILYLTAAVIIVSVATVFFFLYVIFASLAYGGDSTYGSGYMADYSDSTFKRWWWYNRNS